MEMPEVLILQNADAAKYLYKCLILTTMILTLSVIQEVCKETLCWIREKLLVFWWT